MSDFTDFLFSEAPWLRPLLAYVVGGLLVLLAWVVLSPIAYFLWKFLLRVRGELADFIVKQRDRFGEGRENRAKRLDTEADGFLADGGLSRLKSGPASQWSAELQRLGKALNRLRDPINKAATALNVANERVPELVHALQTSETELPVVLPPLPSAREFVESTAGYRKAWLTLVLAVLILIAIMTVNTVMLSQILGGLGLIPPALAVFGIQLAYVLALLMTVVEAGLGVAHSGTLKPGKFTVWPYFFAVLAFGISLVEGFFWSRIAPAKGTVTLPFVGYDMQQSSLFFCFGFALVWTLFGLGAVAHESASEVLGGKHGDLLSRAIGKLKQRYAGYERLVKETTKLLVDAIKESDGIDKKIQGPAANAESVRESLAKLEAEIKEYRKAPPDWAKGGEMPLTRSQVYQLAQMGGLWLVLSVIGAAVMTVIGLGSYSNSTGSIIRWALALGQTVTFFGIGGLLGAGETIVRGGRDDNERKVAAGPVLSTWLAYGLCGVMVSFYIVLAFTTIRGSEWFLNMITGLFLAAAAYHLNPLLNVVRLWLRRVWGVLVLAVQSMWLAFMQVMRFIVVVFESLAYLLGSPFERLWAGRRPKPPQPPEPTPLARTTVAQ